METILQIKNITKSFGNNIVLNDISLEIKKGEILGLIGMSGSGKTTFLNTLIGFVTPEKGDVLFFGKEPFSVYENQDKFKLKIGFAAQLPSYYSRLTVYENLDYFGSLYGLSKKSRKDNVFALLNMVDLIAAKDTLAENLSGGMQRRLDIACALIHDPELLILDEPTSDLDPLIGKHIWLLLQKINKRGTTIIVASHNFSDLEFSCNRIAILSKGKLTVGTLQDLTNSLSKGQEIHLETYPGNYEKILKNFDDTNVIKKENRGHEIIFYTLKPDKVLQKLLPTLSKIDESIIDLKISRINLQDVFSKAQK